MSSVIRMSIAVALMLAMMLTPATKAHAMAGDEACEVILTREDGSTDETVVRRKTKQRLNDDLNVLFHAKPFFGEPVEMTFLLINDEDKSIIESFSSRKTDMKWNWDFETKTVHGTVQVHCE